MIGQLKTLLRVKELKQEQAFRTMQVKRGQVAEATAEHERARDVVAESARTMSSREDAIYADLLGKVVDLDAIDRTRGRVVQLEQDHGRLKDAVERAAHVQHRLEGELDTATQHYKGAVKVRDKYVVITDEVVREAAAAADQREEGEVEELFARPRRRIE